MNVICEENISEERRKFFNDFIEGLLKKDISENEMDVKLIDFFRNRPYSFIIENEIIKIFSLEK